MRSVVIPLIEPFGWEMDSGVWRDVPHPEILRSEDFDRAGGINLHGYMCRSDQVHNLIRKWRVATRHWSAGNGSLRLVVLAEPIISRPKEN